MKMIYYKSYFQDVVYFLKFLQDDLVYQFPKTTLADLRGALITLYHTAQEWSHTKLQQ